MITRKQIEDRLAQIRAEQQKALQHAQMCAGAAQDCEFWLAEWDKAAAEDPQPADPTGWGLPDKMPDKVVSP